MKIEVIESKSGEPTLKINDYFIHSKYNPRREAQQLATQSYTPRHAHILFGYGCGYLLDELLNIVKHNEPIIIIDPLFDNQLIDIKKKHEHLHLYNSKSIEHIEIVLEECALEYRTEFKIICLSNYDKLFPELYKELLLGIKGVQYRNQVNDFTLLRYAKDWQSNFTQNMLNLKKDTNLKSLYQKYSAPVVVASGGPSLMKQLPLLKKYRDTLILIASGSTASTLIAENIEPDYVVSIDGGLPNFNHFKTLFFERAKIIYTMQNHPGVRNSFKKDGYIYGLEGFRALNHYMKNQLNIDLVVVEGGGSVAHSAFSIAQYITSGPIALIGQDLAFTDNLTHARHNRNAKEVDEEFLKKRDAFQVEGYDGEKVWTTPVFYSMKLAFEDLLKVHPPINQFYNCTEGGIKINGYEQISFQTFLQKNALDKVEMIEEVSYQPLLVEVESRIEKEITLYEDLIENLQNGLKYLNQNRLPHQFEEKILKKLDKVDRAVSEIIEQLAIETITVPITMKVQKGFLPKDNETQVESYNRVKKQTEVLYKELITAVEFSLKCAEDVLTKNKGEQ